MLESLLKKYWGYDSFRPLQRDIILSVMQGEDTLALLPTGGGKSICFQLPAVAKEGVCFVFSPLIALMKDQVDGLKKIGISAVALHSGLTSSEIDTELQNTLNGKYKLVYLSPERAASQMFRNYFVNIDVSFLVADEAHCISQWGHNFRPEYMRLGELRELKPKANFIAVTATATGQVVSDILESLHFQKDHSQYQNSFARNNLSYLVLPENNKVRRINEILKKLKGTGIIYANTRRKCEEISKSLQKEGVSVAYYHGGLPNDKRAEIQQNWIDNKTRVVVCTNAFGMGIDKPDVRVVMHYETPESPEAYYQEAGRAGRDGLPAYCVLLADASASKEALWSNYPTLLQIEHALQCLYNHHQVAFTSGQGVTYPFDVLQFAKHFDLKPRLLLSCITVLHSLGFLKLNESIFNHPRAKFKIGQGELYAYQVKNKVEDEFIKVLLRSYGGMFDHYTPLKYDELAQRLKCRKSDVERLLKKLNTDDVIDYIEGHEGNTITYLTGRPTKVSFDKKKYTELRDSEQYRREYIAAYSKPAVECRENYLLSYFGEKKEAPCGKCDLCRLAKKAKKTNKQTSAVIAKIKTITQNKNLEIGAILSSFGTFEEQEIIAVIRWLLDNNYLIKTNQFYTWHQNQA